MRPAKLGRDVDYATSDPGQRHIEGVTETWIGPLAAHWGIEGKQATREERHNLYKGRSPDGSEVRRPMLPDGSARPVIGGNYFPPKTLTAWLAKQPENVREKGEGILHECALYAVKNFVLPNVPARAGHAGAREIPAKAIACLFGHSTDAAGFYNPHTLVEIGGDGLCKDGKFRGLHDKTLFDLQRMSQTYYNARLVLRVHREFGLLLREGPDGLQLKGLEAMAGVNTPRQEQIDAELYRTGFPSTPKTRDFAARATRETRATTSVPASVEKRTEAIGKALRKSSAWLKQKGIDTRVAVVEVARKTSELYEQKMAEGAVKKAVAALDGIGRDLTARDLSTLALSYGTKVGADPTRVQGVVDSVSKSPAEFGLARMDNGSFTTVGIELSRRSWQLKAERLGRKRGGASKSLSLDRLQLSPHPPAVHERKAIAAILSKRLTAMPDATAPLHHVASCFLHNHRRVHVVGAEKTADRLKAACGRTPQTLEAFARQLGKTSLTEAALEMRHHRWRSLRHMEALHRKARQPKLRLEKGDLLILDARGASHHTMNAILQKAATARVTVVLIHDDPIAPNQIRVRNARDKIRSR